MYAVPILCANVIISIDTMLKFDASVDIKAQCERAFRIEVREASLPCGIHDTSGGNVK